MRGALLSQGTTPHSPRVVHRGRAGVVALAARGLARPGPGSRPGWPAYSLYSLSSEVQSVRLSRSSCMMRVESL